MHFADFIADINRLKSIPLGGTKAQFKLAPALRLKYSEEKILASNPKKAAVLALFYPNENNQTSLLLTKRASYNGTHSAQISFPGGKIEQTDQNLQETALRETWEEVGIETSKINVVREITDVYIPPSNFLATPFIGYSNQNLSFSTSDEVAEIIEITLDDLLNDNNLSEISMNTSYMENIKVPCFKFNNHIVWGATGMILSEIKEMIRS